MKKDYLRIKNRAREALMQVRGLEEREGIKAVGLAIKKGKGVFPGWVHRLLGESQGEYYDWGSQKTYPLPDKWRYRFFREAVEVMAESSNEEEAKEGFERKTGSDQDLLYWLASDRRRMQYIDLAQEQFHQKYRGQYFVKFRTQLREAHVWERYEVYGIILEVLKSEKEERMWLEDLKTVRTN